MAYLVKLNFLLLKHLFSDGLQVDLASKWLRFFLTLKDFAQK
ncbi:hypothetical protein N035_007610 [Klebsiella pneumoniae EGD-HP19-C]|nr:hypothetical protein N035_007610 [Klebsiella pneumoniae EGD-HP19-C]